MAKRMFMMSLFLYAGITACTSGGVGSEAAQDASAGVNVPDPGDGTGTINTPARFDFSTIEHYDIGVDISPTTTARGYLSICSDYSFSQNRYNVDYTSCVLRTPVFNGVYEGHVDISAQYSRMIAVIWFNDMSVDPIFREVRLDDDHQITL